MKRWVGIGSVGYSVLIMETRDGEMKAQHTLCWIVGVEISVLDSRCTAPFWEGGEVDALPADK